MKIHDFVPYICVIYNPKNNNIRFKNRLEIKEKGENNQEYIQFVEKQEKTIKDKPDACSV